MKQARDRINDLLEVYHIRTLADKLGWSLFYLEKVKISGNVLSLKRETALNTLWEKYNGNNSD